MQTTGQVEIVANTVPDWQTPDETEIVRRVSKSKRRKKSLREARVSLSADRLVGFAQAVRKSVAGALCRCEEFYPQEGPQSVVYVVVDKDAEQWRERLQAFHTEYFGAGKSDRLAPVHLEVIDRAAHDSLQRLIGAGVIARTTRFARSLWPVDESTTSPPPLSEAEQDRAESYRRQAARKLKMARVLASGDLAEEARLALLEAIEPLGHALAVESRLPEPQSLEDSLLPPLGVAWKDALPLVRSFLRETSQPVTPILNVLAQI